MTYDNDPSCLPRIPEMEYIQSILTSNNLVVRDERKVTRGIITAVQPLTIDGKEICTDTLLAEFVAYKTADQMVRETETMTIKKAAFGAFESSMTPIPKYCFRNSAANEAVLVHSVPRFTLDDILNVCEREYPRPYTYKQFGFYADWLQTILGRTRSHTQPGKLWLFKMAAELPKHIFPEPPRIVQLQRQMFAALILRTVEQHHRNNIYHDCISERTIFFPTPYQPLVLSSYSGVPSSMLADLIPPELMTDEAVANYGPQCRDIYCCALLCYRIMTGENHDGRRFSLESPRPAGMVASEIARCARLTCSFRSPADARHTLLSLFGTVKAIILLVPLLFSCDRFAAWRKINRATGGLWRSIPAVGPFCDVFVPTQKAQALRYVLDKAWFSIYFFRKGPPHGRPDSRGPDITMLAAAFKVRGPVTCPQFESALNALISESAQKRKVFSSIMESGLSIRKAYRLMADRRYALLFLVLVTIIAAMFIALQSNSRKRTAAAEAEKTAVTASSEGANGAAAISAVRNPSASNTEEPGNVNRLMINKKIPLRAMGAPVAANATQPVRKAAAAMPVNKTAGGGRPESRRPPGKRPAADSARNISSVKTTEPAPTAIGTLHSAIGFRDVFIVTGVTDSCNPGKLYYSRGGQKDTIMISQLPKAAPRLFLVHRSSAGFGAIETVRLCRADGCDRTMYYVAEGAKGTGRPVYIRTGDVISLDRINLRLFVQARQSLYKK
jgi:hypothetical protein